MGPAQIDEELAGQLQRACFEAMRGDPPGHNLARRLERECIAILHQHGLKQAVVQATSNTTNTVVNILLPRPGKPVQQVRLRLQ